MVAYTLFPCCRRLTASCKRSLCTGQIVTMPRAWRHTLAEGLVALSFSDPIWHSSAEECCSQPTHNSYPCRLLWHTRSLPMTTKFTTMRFNIVKSLLSWRFPSCHGVSHEKCFWMIFLSAPNAPPLKNANLICIVVLPSLTYCPHRNDYNLNT